MGWIPITIAIFAGFVLGLVVAFALRVIQAKTAKELASELFRESETQRKENVDAVIENVKASFGNLSLDALEKSTGELLKLAKSKLESEREISAKELDVKKGLIDQQLQLMTSELEKVSGLMKELEKDRVEKFGELANQLKTASEQTIALRQTTNTLSEALSSTKVRGQWGERMAEDVLRLAGFIKNVNYLKQETQETIEGAKRRPDFTFLLPRELKLNMDVKFPLDNYIKFLEASGLEKEGFRKEFLKNVKKAINEVTTRDYINPEQNTLDYVLLFIPNEQVYAFIYEQGSEILDEGIKNKVVFCSPMTLFAVLAVIRQAVDNFALGEASNEVLLLLSAIEKQWGEFLEKLEKMGRGIKIAQGAYEELTGTRQRAIEKPLGKIKDLIEQRGLSIMLDENEGSLPVIEEVERENEGDAQQFPEVLEGEEKGK